MTTLEMREAMAARATLVWPEPEQAAVVVESGDKRVPASARSVARLAEGAGWTVELSYARGTSMVGKDCQPGPVNASVLLRARRASERVAAVWLAKPRATCQGCGKIMTPTATGKLAKHGKGAGADRDGQVDECAGSGQVATLNALTLTDFAFSAAYATEGPGWFTAHVPDRLNATQLKVRLAHDAHGQDTAR